MPCTMCVATSTATVVISQRCKNSFNCFGIPKQSTAKPRSLNPKLAVAAEGGSLLESFGESEPNRTIFASRHSRAQSLILSDGRYNRVPNGSPQSELRNHHVDDGPGRGTAGRLAQSGACARTTLPQ